MSYPKCTYELRKQGVAYPRTCAECGLGPCKAGHSKPPETPWILPVSGALTSADIAALRASHQRLKEALERISDSCPKHQSRDCPSTPSDFGNAEDYAEDYSLEMERVVLSAIGDIAREALRSAQ